MDNILSEFLKSIKVLILAYVFLLISTSCASLKVFTIQKQTSKKIEKSEVFSQFFTGLSVYDPEKKEFLINIDDDKYFTPASNIKILTLATYLSMNLDSIPTFWLHNDGSITPLGDPTFLHPDFNYQPAVHWLQNLAKDSLAVRTPLKVTRYGPGWAWDDYFYNYQPERSVFPLYGNMVRVKLVKEEVRVTPKFFEPYVETSAKTPFRLQQLNIFNIPLDELSDSSDYQIPFITDEELLEVLLEDTLYRDISFSGFSGGQIIDTVYNQPSLPVLALMMQRSDNFLAEQLLVNAQIVSGRSSVQSMIYYTGATVFRDTPDQLIWVDGSGLSRYNMLTPRSVVYVLNSIYELLSWQEIKLVFPNGGKSGTIRNWYRSETPYVYAKTGTLRHNHNLSGFLKTKSGKTLIFSFMNNHYPFSSTKVKKAMEEILVHLRDRY